MQEPPQSQDDFNSLTIPSELEDAIVFPERKIARRDHDAVKSVLVLNSDVKFAGV